MNDQQIRGLLLGLHSRKPEEAWRQFLQLYSAPILQVIHVHERDPDHISDCFLFVCERLSRSRFRRLRRFRFDGGARFSTWLWAVVRNLCRDWHRKEFGRHRISRSIARLADADRAVFRCVYEQGLTREETFCWLVGRNPGLTREQVEDSCDRIDAVLTHRQLWLLSLRKRERESIEGEPGARQESLRLQIPDPAPDPQAALALNERYVALEKALRQLSKPERLLITLRYEQGLTLQEIADLLDLKDPWVVERQIKQVLDAMRNQMSSLTGLRAKARDASV